jgi:hypothetical protein
MAEGKREILNFYDAIHPSPCERPLCQADFHPLPSGEALQRGSSFGNYLPAFVDNFIERRIGAFLVVVKQAETFHPGVEG